MIFIPRRWQPWEDSILKEHYQYTGNLRLLWMIEDGHNGIDPHITLVHIQNRLNYLKLRNRPMVTRVRKNTRIEILESNSLLLPHLTFPYFYERECWACNQAFVKVPSHHYLDKCYLQEIRDPENLFCLNCYKYLLTTDGRLKPGISDYFTDNKVDLIASIILINKINNYGNEQKNQKNQEHNIASR